MNKITNIPNSNISRFNDIANAISYRNRMAKYHPPIIMGCDGRFWVTSTNRQASILINAGYEAV